MKTKFLCSNGDTIPIRQCFKSCPLGTRCAPYPYLLEAGADRPRESIPSVTQLLLGTREAYLKITQDYAVNPLSEVYAILGTATHSILGNSEFGLSDGKLFGWNIQGTPDLVASENGKNIIEDYKVIGSYKVALMLGMGKEEIETGEFYKNGKPKTKKVFHKGWEKAENWEYTMQLNMYRILYEDKTGEKIHQLKNFCIVRDGGTIASKSRGIFENTAYIDVPILDDAVVKEYFFAKRDALLDALNNKEMPPICAPRERWDNNKKCESYCDVKQWCPADDIERQTGW